MHTQGAHMPLIFNVREMREVEMEETVYNSDEFQTFQASEPPLVEENHRVERLYPIAIAAGRGPAIG